MVVSGRAMMSPTKPSREPQTERARRMMAGLRPVTLPMMRGVRMRSWMAWTMAKTARAERRIVQKLSPVLWALRAARIRVGMKPMTWR